MTNLGSARLVTDFHRQQTRVIEQFSQAPLQWLGPLDPQGIRPIFYLRNPNGGLLAGDAHRIQIQLGSQTQLEIRTQSATRIHPGACEQTIELSLAADSTLIWLPHPLIPGSDSHYQQSTRIEIHPTARLAYGEIWTAGRIGMGECWQFQHLTSDLTIQTQSGLALSERVELSYPHSSVTSDSILGSYTCWGSLYLIGAWPEVEWPMTATQWSVPSPDPQCPGSILRQVGKQAETLWSDFQQAVAQGLG